MLLNVFHKRHPPVGSRPGTLMTDPDAKPPAMCIFEYSVTEVDEVTVTSLDQVRAAVTRGRRVWLDVQGLGDETTLRGLAEIFDIHALALEDVVNAPQRPKIEGYDTHQLLISRMIQVDPDNTLDIEQVGILFGKGYVVTFQEREGDVFGPVRKRLREGIGPIRAAGSDYLAYALLDTIVDGYYPVIEQLGEDLADVEHRMMIRQSHRQLDRLNHIRSALVGVNRAILPHREFLLRLQRDGSPFISKDVLVYLRDTLDHCSQLADVVESNREMASGTLNTYLSLVGMRTNDVMKVLTIMASIFIPLTFMAGIYGMNFETMPELHADWAYPVLLAVMALTAGGRLFYFRRRGWIGQGDEDEE
jgi:magnesium transporter